MIHDLVYADSGAEKIVTGRFPTARITDASDFIHTERFEVDIEGVEWDAFMLDAGLGLVSLSIQIACQMKDEILTPLIEKWLADKQAQRGVEDGRQA